VGIFLGAGHQGSAVEELAASIAAAVGAVASEPAQTVLRAITN
jgi:hypothetical protein